jgi:hypothetical protein
MRYILTVKKGFCFWDTYPGSGRFIGNDGSSFDLDEKNDKKLIEKILNEGEIATSYGTGSKLKRRKL